MLRNPCSAASGSRLVEERSTSAKIQRKARLIFAAVLCTGGLATALWYFGYSSQYATYRIETHDAVSGLIADSPVELHGVEIGKVTRIELIDPQTVNILLSIAKNAPISKSTVATITARGLAARGFTGYVYVALENTGPDSGTLSSEPGERYPIIPSAPSRTYTMDTTVANVTQKAEALTRLLQSLLDEKTIVSLKRSVDGLQEVAAVLAANNERLGSFIVNAERDSRAVGRLMDEKTVTSLKRSADGLGRLMATLTTDNKRLTSLILNAERDSRDIRPVLNASNATLRELRTDLLPQFYRTIGDLDGLTRLMTALANRMTRDPSTAIRGTAVPPGPGER